MAEMVLIDDTDSSITYSSGWFSETGNLDTIGTFGPPFLSTVHGTQGKASFAVSFTGTKFNIIGSIQDDRSSNSGSTTQWQCIVDGSPISPANPTQVGNRQSLCGETLSDGPHQVVVQAIGTSQQTFWFDFLQYIPSPTASLTDSTTLVQFTSSQIQHNGSGWMTVINNSGILTNSQSNSVKYTFEGFKLIWYGLYDSSFPSGESTATYSIDGGPSTSFTLNNARANGNSMFNQIIFVIDGISPGTHTLEVVYTGNSSGTPLSVQAIARFGQAASVSSSSSTTISPTPPTLSSMSSSNSGSSTPSMSSPQSLSFFSMFLTPSGVSAGSTATPSPTSTSNKFSATVTAPQTSGSGTIPRSSSVKLSTSAPGSTASPQHNKPSAPNISTIVAAVLVPLLLLSIISLVCLRRRRLRLMKKSARPFPFFSRFTNVNATPKSAEAPQNQSERAQFHETAHRSGEILVIGRTSQAYLPTLPQKESPSLQVQVEDAPPPAYVTI